MSQSEGKYKSVTPTESQERPTKAGGAGGPVNVKPRPELFAPEEDSGDEREELDFQLDFEMGGAALKFESDRNVTYASSSDGDDSIIADDELGNVVLITKVQSHPDQTVRKEQTF